MNDHGDVEIIRADGNPDVVAAETLYPDSFSEYLSQPCDDCPDTATHNGVSTVTGKRGRFCNAHTSWDAPAFARDD